MKVKHLIDQIKHIDKVVSDIQKLRNLDEEFMYELESKAGFEYSTGIIVDVAEDVMESWKKVLQDRIENAEVEEEI